LPSFVGTPLQLALTGQEGSFTPARFSGTALVLRFGSGSASMGPGLGSSVTETVSQIIETLFANEAIVDAQGRPTRRFQQMWENTISQIKAILTSQGLSIDELQRIYSGINTAQATAAGAAQQAQQTQASINIADSYPNPPGVLTASNDGTVIIAAHSRIYADGTSVAVNSGAVTGLANGASVTIYYIDSAREGGAVTYQGTTSPIAQADNTHVVGVASIPLAGEVAVPGYGVPAPGFITPEQAAAYQFYNPRM
jgi:hypothetical protein